MHAAGASLSAISRQVGADRKTLRQWLRAGAMPSWRHPRRGGVLDAYREHLDRRWTEGCHNAARLWRELTALGFTGGAPLVRAWATARRRANPGKARALQTRSGKPWRPPSGRRVARLLMAEPRTLPRPARAFVQRLLEDTPALAVTFTAAKRIERVLRKQSNKTLADVLAVAEITQLGSFVAKIRKDITAVETALRLPWTTSPAERQISRIKMIKRTMYGRAGFDLLRTRILHTA
nr:transposase [Paracraurococcus ruber]